MDQPVLMNPEIHKGAEAGDVRHHSFQEHPGLHLIQGGHVRIEGRCDELLPGVSSGLLQFLEDVLDRGKSHALIDEILGTDGDLGRKDLLQGTPERPGDPLDQLANLGAPTGDIDQMLAEIEAGRG